MLTLCCGGFSGDWFMGDGIRSSMPSHDVPSFGDVDTENGTSLSFFAEPSPPAAAPAPIPAAPTPLPLPLPLATPSPLPLPLPASLPLPAAALALLTAALLGAFMLDWDMAVTNVCAGLLTLSSSEVASDCASRESERCNAAERDRGLQRIGMGDMWHPPVPASTLPWLPRVRNPVRGEPTRTPCE